MKKLFKRLTGLRIELLWGLLVLHIETDQDTDTDKKDAVGFSVHHEEDDE